MIFSCKIDENSFLLPKIKTTTLLSSEYAVDDISSEVVNANNWRHNKENNQYLYLDSSIFNLWSSVERVVIHSCKKLTIKENAFYGIEITDQLKFIDIQTIEIQSFAFLGIKQAPKQIVIQDSGIKTIASHAFTGLSHIEHFWWRNVTINKIAKLAFAKVLFFLQKKF